MPQLKKKTLNASFAHRMYLLSDFPPLCGDGEWSGQCKGWPDHIPDYHWAEPGQADPGKSTDEWRQHFSGVLSKWQPGSVLLRSSLDVTAALFSWKCVYSGFGDPYKAKRIDNSLHELGRAGQTNTGASRAGKPDNQPGSRVLINIHTCGFN